MKWVMYWHRKKQTYRWHRPVTPEFQESLGYIVRPHENKTQKIKQVKKINTSSWILKFMLVAYITIWELIGDDIWITNIRRTTLVSHEYMPVEPALGRGKRLQVWEQSGRYTYTHIHIQEFQASLGYVTRSYFKKGARVEKRQKAKSSLIPDRGVQEQVALLKVCHPDRLQTKSKSSSDEQLWREIALYPTRNWGVRAYPLYDRRSNLNTI